MGNEFKEFVEARYVELLRIAYLLTGSAHEAEDLVQAALVKVMRRWHKIDEPLAYLRRMLVNQHISWWKRIRRRELVTDTPPERGTVRDVAEGVVLRDELAAALRSLPPRTRAVVVLRFLADLPEAEVAQVLGCSVGTVKSQTSRGLARLRGALSGSDSEMERMTVDVDR